MNNIIVVPKTAADIGDQHWLDDQIVQIENGIEAVLDIALNWTENRNLSRLHPGVSAQDYILAHVKHPLGRGVVVPLLEASNWSNRQIAEVAGVSHPTVGKVRAELEKTYQLEPAAETLGADGKLRPARVVREVTAEVVEPTEATEPAAAPLWDALLKIIADIEALPDADAIVATVPAKRQASTARKLRHVGTTLGGIAWKLERLTRPTPEEERARREAEEAARPEKAQRELEAAQRDLERQIKASAKVPGRDQRDTAEIYRARRRVEQAEDQVIALARMAEDRARHEARREQDRAKPPEATDSAA
ncbi:MAG: hypothetical protein ABSA21_03225 [Candidatus Limnocylindrales bacterium]|jgi:hypothetical protein